MTVLKGAKLIPELLIKPKYQFNAILHDSVLLISGLKEKRTGMGGGGVGGGQIHMLSLTVYLTVLFYLIRLERVFSCTCARNLNTPLLRCTRQRKESNQREKSRENRSCNTLMQMRKVKLSQIGFGYFSCNP